MLPSLPASLGRFGALGDSLQELSSIVEDLEMAVEAENMP